MTFQLTTPFKAIVIIAIIAVASVSGIIYYSQANSKSHVVRDYFVVASAWFKGQGLPYVPFTVDALPFQNMTSYLYPLTENYPYDAAHSSYLSEYNSRIINAQNPDLLTQSVDASDKQVRTFESLAACAAFLILIALPIIAFAYRRRRNEAHGKILGNRVGDCNTNFWFGSFLF